MKRRDIKIIVVDSVDSYGYISDKELTELTELYDPDTKPMHNYKKGWFGDYYLRLKRLNSYGNILHLIIYHKGEYQRFILKNTNVDFAWDESMNILKRILLENLIDILKLKSINSRL